MAYINARFNYCDTPSKEKKIDVNFYLNVRFRICMSLIPLQATCHVYLLLRWIHISLCTHIFHMLVIYYRSKRAFGDLETFVTGEV
jgi:hypothetical protein